MLIVSYQRIGTDMLSRFVNI